MSAMAVAQAVFASSDRGKIKGYQLISHSPGVSRTTRDTLARWAPTRLLSEQPNNWIISGFPLADNTFAVARTILGGPEYSGRGGTQVVTLFLLLTNNQYAAYGFNPITVAANAMALGSMRLPMQLNHEALPQVVLPALPIACPSKLRVSVVKGGGAEPIWDEEASYGRHKSLLDEVVSLLEADRRVALIGLSDPVRAAAELIARLPECSRKTLNLSTGLSTSIRRSFNVQFFPSHDSFRRLRNEGENLTCLEL